MIDSATPRPGSPRLRPREADEEAERRSKEAWGRVASPPSGRAVHAPSEPWIVIVRQSAPAGDSAPDEEHPGLEPPPSRQTSSKASTR